MTKDKPIVIVIEDDETTQVLYWHILGHQYELHITDNVADAIILLQEHAADLIIVDLSLKGDEDGIGLVHHVRASMSNPNIPIIAITAHAFPHDRAKVLDAGSNEYVPKPISPASLIKLIERYLP
ncbi:MAG: response regulator [Candidatus Marinimicrobia bacterium]|nr:response regulator [Candidatus Neomarinimicrobiota bacterium]